MATKRGLPEKRRMRHDRHFVDELTARTGGDAVGRMVSLTSIDPSTDQPRVDFDDIEELVTSVERHGVLEPLLVRRIGSRYQLVSGERRLRAAQQARLEEVPCIELDITDEQALEIALVENLQRRDLSAFEEAEGFRSLVERYGYTHEDVAQAVGKSRVSVTESLQILSIPDDVRETCRHADITAKGVLLEISRARSPELMRALVEEIIREGLDRSALRERRQQLVDSPEAADAANAGRAPAQRPFVMRFRHPDQGFSIALSFPVDRQPDSRAVIAALEQMIQELREDMDAGGGAP